MNRTLYAITLPIITLLATGGCNGNDDREISGVVLTTRGLDRSHIDPLIQEVDDEYKPVPGAEVRLAFDKDGHRPVTGYESKSDAAGKYTIKLKGIPRSPTEYGNAYYLLAKKEGYEPLVFQVSIGPFGHYMTNTVLLKKK